MITSVSKSCSLAALAAGLFVSGGQAQEAPVYKNAHAPLEDRVNDLFHRLTPDEKLALLGGTGFTTQPIPRLEVPAMGMADAGQGVRGGTDGTQGAATAFPCGALMASTWDTNLIARIGRAIGEEVRNKGTGASILLGPAVNIHRSPLGGRNAEYFSEDPFLAARMAVAYIRGLQSSGASACIKHFACNNEEVDRNDVNVIVSERALREIYLPAFEAGVREGQVWAVMSSYNEVNGFHSSANSRLLKEILKAEWGFNGLVMSDWGGVHETAVVQAGNDLEMPTGDNMSVPKLKAALANGSVTQAAVDDSVQRILRTIVRVGLLDGPASPDARLVNSREHDRLAFEAATKGIVLLKNANDLLPLDCSRIKSMAVIGEAADNLQVGALGSPEVKPLHTTQLLDGIKNRIGRVLKIRYVAARTDGELVPGAIIRQSDGTAGFRAEYFKNMDLQGEPELTRSEEKIDIVSPAPPAPGIPTTHFSVRWTGMLVAPETGIYALTFIGDDGFRIFLDGKPLIDHWVEEAATAVTAQADLKAGKAYDLRIEYFQNGGDFAAQFNWQRPNQTPYAEAVNAATNSDIAVVCISTRGTEGEGNDRPSMDLPANQSALIRAVAAANSNTIVVLNNGTPVTMKEWLGRVPALLEAWFPGQEGGAALAAILFGDVNPSGKLPDTLAASRDDYPDHGNFPGANHQVKYAEDIFVGYRHFDRNGIAPLFPFGFGLSYTSFEYKNLKVGSPQLAPGGSLTATVDVVNTGQRPGEEVAELYVYDSFPRIERPIRELKGFSKVALKPGELKTITFVVKPRDLAYFDVVGHQWKSDAGNYEIGIGSSSRDIRLTAPVQLTATYTEPVVRLAR
ncbi:MAG: glycoside hydrolase family 3 C-terminal domain-containing protein [Verrucomicrobiota bacterium]|jgi:beta-glucosidase